MTPQKSQLKSSLIPPRSVDLLGFPREDRAGKGVLHRFFSVADDPYRLAPDFPGRTSDTDRELTLSEL